MIGLFDDSGDHPDFAWDERAFKFLGEEDKREDYLKELTGRDGPTAEIVAQLRDLDESDVRQIVRQIPDDVHRKEMLKVYYNSGV
jgi:hypothetical protein